MNRPLIMAHRGFRGVAPENTMAAFRAAVAAGADGIELDVHLTRDGVPVILHDERLDRTCDAQGFVRDYSLAELRRVRAAGHSGVQEDVGVPTLREYLTWAREQPIFTNIEIKDNTWYYAEIEEKVCALVEELGMEEKVIFSCFNHASLSLAKSRLPDVGCGALCERPIGNAGAYLDAVGLDFLHPEYHHLRKEDVENCHAHGIGVNVWGVNLEEEILGACAMGVDGIITDEVERAVRLLRDM